MHLHNFALVAHTSSFYLGVELRSSNILHIASQHNHTLIRTSQDCTLRRPSSSLIPHIPTETAKMVLEATMIVQVLKLLYQAGANIAARVDNSESSRNGDYV